MALLFPPMNPPVLESTLGASRLERLRSERELPKQIANAYVEFWNARAPSPDQMEGLAGLIYRYGALHRWLGEMTPARAIDFANVIDGILDAKEEALKEAWKKGWGGPIEFDDCLRGLPTMPFLSSLTEAMVKTDPSASQPLVLQRYPRRHSRGR